MWSFPAPTLTLCGQRHYGLLVQDNLDADIFEVEEDLYDDDVISNESVCSEEGRQQPEDTIIATSPAMSVENQFKELQEIKEVMIEVKELMKTFVEQFKQCPSSGMIASPCTSSSSGSDITTPKRTGTKSIPLNIRVIS